MARRIVETGSEYLGAEQSAAAPEEFGQEELQVIDKPLPEGKVAIEKFMQEPVTIIISEGTSENDAELVMVGVNGVSQYIKRGIPQTVKRKYVERLARAKETNYAQAHDLGDLRMGEAMNRMSRRNAFKYPFQVVRDDNPMGAPWLQAILSERQ